MTARAAGYSGTPLWKKLGLKSGLRVLLLNPPADIEALLSGAPRDLDRLAQLVPFDFALALFTSRDALMAALARLEPNLAPDGVIWIAWPKKASGHGNRFDRECRTRRRACARPGRRQGVRDRRDMVGAQARALLAGPRRPAIIAAIDNDIRPA
jgi:hypothetical protein